MVKKAQRKKKLRIHFINKTPTGLEFKIKEIGKANKKNKKGPDIKASLLGDQDRGHKKITL